MLTCFYKKYLGIDCPGCGMQRATNALLVGDLETSLALYPMLIPILMMFVFLALHLKFKFAMGHKILIFFFIGNSAGILLSWVCKLWG